MNFCELQLAGYSSSASRFHIAANSRAICTNDNIVPNRGAVYWSRNSIPRAQYDDLFQQCTVAKLVTSKSAALQFLQHPERDRKRHYSAQIKIVKIIHDR